MDSHEEELGRKVAAAFLSHMKGVKSIDKYLKTDVKAVSEFWIDMGKYITKAFNKRAKNLLGGRNGK